MADSTHYFTRDIPMSDIQGASQVMPGMNNGHIIPKFFTRTVKDEAMSAARGRFVPREIEMVKLIIPGDKHSMPERRVRESDKVKYAREYEAFKKQQEIAPDGTPLESWPLLSRAQVEDLKYANIFTVEALAQIADDKLPSLGIGGRTLRRQAEMFLKTSETGRVPAQLVEENERLKVKIEMLATQLQDITDRFEKALAKAGKNIADEANPMLEVRAKVEEVTRAEPTTVAVPKDYRDLPLKDLKNLCKDIAPNVPILNKASAFEVIEDYLAS